MFVPLPSDQSRMSSLARFAVLVAAIVGASGFPLGSRTVRADRESFVAFGGGVSGVSGLTGQASISHSS